MVLNYERDFPHGMGPSDDPLTLLSPEEGRKDWRVGFNYPVFTALAFGIGYPVLRNFFRQVPLKSGIIQYPICTVIGYVAGSAFEQYRGHKLALRDAHYRQYIKNHLEDFQPILPSEKKKVGDLLKPWTPVR